MKNLFLTITAGLFLLTGCSKDDSLELIEPKSTDLIYVLDQNMDQANFNAIEIDNFQAEAKFSTSTETSEFGSTSGYYEPAFRNTVILEWSANRDERGTSGTAELQISNPSYSMHFIMETECISIDGGVAMYGAIITEVIELTGDTPPLTVAWRLYFQVKDGDNNGTKRLNFDQMSNKWIFASPRSPSLCSVYPPKHPIWSSNGYENVLSPGFVEVSN